MFMKANLILDSDNRIISYTTFPLDPSKDIYEIDNNINITNGEYGIQNGVVIKIGFTSKKLKEIEENKLNNLRIMRVKLLEAFDKWEKGVLRGREVEDINIMTWYYNLLDLKETSFKNIPERINYYL